MSAEAAPLSPISQVLHTIGLTRDDLAKRSTEMRDFLGHDFNPPPLPSRRPSRSRAPSTTTPAPDAPVPALAPAPVPPTTPVKSEPADASPRKTPRAPAASMERVMERKSRQSQREKRARRERERVSGHASPSPSPSRSAHSTGSRAGVSTRASRRDSFSESSLTGRSSSSQVSPCAFDASPC
jgi:hypothetical protein